MGERDAAHDVGERRAIDARLFDEVRLAQTLVSGNGCKHGILTGRQIVAAHLGLEHVGRTLPGPMQEMDRRPVERRQPCIRCRLALRLFSSRSFHLSRTIPKLSGFNGCGPARVNRNVKLHRKRNTIARNASRRKGAAGPRPAWCCRPVRLCRRPPGTGIVAPPSTSASASPPARRSATP